MKQFFFSKSRRTQWKQSQCLSESCGPIMGWALWHSNARVSELLSLSLGGVANKTETVLRQNVQDLLSAPHADVHVCMKGKQVSRETNTEEMSGRTKEKYRSGVGDLKAQRAQVFSILLVSTYISYITASLPNDLICLRKKAVPMHLQRWSVG